MLHMPDAPTVTLEVLARQTDRILTELAGFRDDMREMSALVMRLEDSLTRLEGSNAALLQETPSGRE
jgi:hypothetical protein